MNIGRRSLPLAVLLCLVVPGLGWAQTPTEVQATPTRLDLTVGDRERLFLSAYDADGNLLSDAKYTFLVSRTGVVRVERDGTIVALKPGSARIEVRAGSGRASVAVTVAGEAATDSGPPPSLPAGTVLIPTPPVLYLLALETARVTVALQTPDGSGLGQVHVTWTSVDPTIASVNSTGLVVGLQPGSGSVQATGPGGLTITVPVLVAQSDFALDRDRLLLAPEAIDTLRAIVPSQGGRRLLSGLEWRSTDPSIVRVDATGRLQAVAPGSAEIIVVGYQLERRVRVTVHAPLSRIRFSPPPGEPVRLPIHTTMAMSLKFFAADSSPIAEVPLAWTVLDTAVVGFDPATRTLTARSLGKTELALAVPGFEPFQWEVQVVPAGLALIRTRFRLAVGGRDSLRISLLDEAGRPLGGSGEIAFHSDRPDVVAVDSAGRLEAKSVGGATITARAAWGSESSVRVFVTEDLLLSLRQGSGAGIYQVSTAAGAPLTPLLADSTVNFHPVWSPDRTRVAFSSRRNGDIDIYTMDADGANIRQLTKEPGADLAPTWSPDGGTIAFSSVRGGTTQIYAMNADGTGLRQLTSDSTVNQSPVYSPDGHFIAFVSTRDGNPDLFVMEAEGENPRPLTRTPEAESQPRFFPNGDVAYVVQRGERGDILRLNAGPEGRRIMLQSLKGRITSLALSRDGAMLAYVVAPAKEGDTAAGSSLMLKGLAPDQPPRPVTLPPGAQPIHPGF
ncbi:MAG TPA: Ig-like domain-containing protein [Gemmatimonadales bacterium]|nr:Ig-like domain-containing protein [Gemmatimonadales bacterium]